MRHSKGDLQHGTDDLDERKEDLEGGFCRSALGHEAAEVVENRVGGAIEHIFGVAVFCATRSPDAALATAMRAVDEFRHEIWVINGDGGKVVGT